MVHSRSCMDDRQVIPDLSHVEHWRMCLHFHSATLSEALCNIQNPVLSEKPVLPLLTSVFELVKNSCLSFLLTRCWILQLSFMGFSQNPFFFRLIEWMLKSADWVNTEMGILETHDYKVSQIERTRNCVLVVGSSCCALVHILCIEGYMSSSAPPEKWVWITQWLMLRNLLVWDGFGIEKSFGTCLEVQHRALSWSLWQVLIWTSLFCIVFFIVHEHIWIIGRTCIIEIIGSTWPFHPI